MLDRVVFLYQGLQGAQHLPALCPEREEVAQAVLPLVMGVM